jgi:hypothetical protein
VNATFPNPRHVFNNGAVPVGAIGHVSDFLNWTGSVSWATHLGDGASSVWLPVLCQATNAAYMSMCVKWHVPEDVDIVFVRCPGGLLDRLSIVMLSAMSTGCRGRCSLWEQAPFRGGAVVTVCLSVCSGICNQGVIAGQTMSVA